MITKECPKCHNFSESMTYHVCPFCAYRDDGIGIKTVLSVGAVFVVFLIALLAMT